MPLFDSTQNSLQRFQADCAATVRVHLGCKPVPITNFKSYYLPSSMVIFFFQHREVNVAWININGYCISNADLQVRWKNKRPCLRVYLRNTWHGGSLRVHLWCCWLTMECWLKHTLKLQHSMMAKNINLVSRRNRVGNLQPLLKLILNREVIRFFWEQ